MSCTICTVCQFRPTDYPLITVHQNGGSASLCRPCLNAIEHSSLFECDICGELHKAPSDWKRVSYFQMHPAEVPLYQTYYEYGVYEHKEHVMSACTICYDHENGTANPYPFGRPEPDVKPFMHPDAPEESIPV
jgi:hypothetical protein